MRLELRAPVKGPISSVQHHVPPVTVLLTRPSPCCVQAAQTAGQLQQALEQLTQEKSQLLQERSSIQTRLQESQGTMQELQAQVRGRMGLPQLEL